MVCWRRAFPMGGRVCALDVCIGGIGRGFDDFGVILGAWVGEWESITCTSRVWIDLPPSTEGLT